MLNEKSNQKLQTMPVSRTISTPDWDIRNVITEGVNLAVKGNSTEWNVSQSIVKSMGKTPSSSEIFIPDFVWGQVAPSKRDLSAGSDAVLIETEVAPGIADALVPFSACAAAGMTILDNLRTNLQFARWASASSPSGLAENTTATASTAETFSAMEIGPPQRTNVDLHVSNQWLKQTAFNGRTAVVKQILKAIGSKLDSNVISFLLGLSQNTGDQSTALQNLALLGAGQTFGGPASWATLQALKETVLANDAIDNGDLSWIISPATYGKFSTVQKASGSSFYLIEDIKIGPDRVFATTNLSSTNQVLFGKFPQVTLGLWPVSIMSDPF
jgi:HK97 family phage major capsid protein